MKAALKHPEVFSACIAMDGIYDMGKICERAKQGETVVCHNEESLKAVFGDIDHIKGVRLVFFRHARGVCRRAV